MLTDNSNQNWSPWFDWWMGVVRSSAVILIGAFFSMQFLSDFERARKTADFKWQAEFKLRSESLASFQRCSSLYLAHEYDAIKGVFFKSAPTKEDFSTSRSPDDDRRAAMQDFTNAEKKYEEAIGPYQGESYDNLQSAKRKLRVAFDLSSLDETANLIELPKLKVLLDEYARVRRCKYRIFSALQSRTSISACFREDDGEIWYPDGVVETSENESPYATVDHDGEKVSIWTAFSDDSSDSETYREYGYLRRRAKDLAEEIMDEGFRLIRNSVPE